VGDCRISLQLLDEMVEDVQLGDLASRREPWLERIADWKRSQPLSYQPGTASNPNT